MTAISTPMKTVLRTILQERFVPLLPPLIGNQNQDANHEKQVSRAFNAFVLEKLFDLNARDAAGAVVDDFADNGIDAIYYHEPNETLYLLQSKMKSSHDFKKDEAEAFTAGIRLLVEQELDNFNQHVKDKAQYIENALDHCSAIKLVVAYTGNSITGPAVNALNQLVNDNTLDEERIDTNILYIDSQQIETHLRSEQSIRPVNTRLKIGHSQKIDQPRKTVFGLVKVLDLVNLHQQHDKALYQKNIRYFIGSGTRGVNRAIKNTLEHNPESFLHLNNGITAVCTGIEPKRSRGGYKDYVIAGFSVVNGAQTISSAAQFIRENPEVNIDVARVMITLIKTPDNGDFHKQVTKARNLQNPVSMSNFAALDDNQERLRQDMALFGVDYHYRPQQSNSARRVITIDELAKALACLQRNIDYPARLKAEPGLFTDTESTAYNRIFTDTLTGCAAINAVLVHSIIHDLLQAADRGAYSPERLVYRHCLYPLSHLLLRRFKNRIESGELLHEAQIRTDISAPFDDLRQLFSDRFDATAYGGAPYAFFRRIGDNARLIRDVAIRDLQLEGDPTVLHLKGQVDTNDPYNQALSNYLIGKIQQI